MPEELSNRFGRVSDFSLLEADPREFKVRLRSAVDQRLSLSSPVSALLRLKNKDGVAVFCLVMPMPSLHRLRYYGSPEWHTYLSYIAETLRHDNVGLLDASAWIPDDGFADPLHLNSEGANRFSSRLARALLYDSAMVAKPESIR